MKDLIKTVLISILLFVFPLTASAWKQARISDTAYNASSWNGVTNIAPSKNAVRDKIEAMGGGAPSGAKYIVQQADGTLSAEQAMGALGTGSVWNTTTTGVQSISASLTSIGGLTEADVSIIETTADNAYAVVTSGGNDYILGSNSGNTALEFKASTGSGAAVLDTSPSFTTNITTPKITLSGADVSPSATNEIVYDTTVTGLSGGALAWYDNDEIRYLVDLEVLPTNDDYVVSYDAVNDNWYMKLDATGGSTAWDDIGAPDANDEIDFGNYIIEIKLGATGDFRIGDGGTDYVKFGEDGDMTLQGGTTFEGVTATTFGYLDPTSGIQAQLDARCLESVFGTSLGTGMTLDGTALKTHAALQSIAGLTETNGGLAYGTADNAYAWLGAGAQGTLLMGNAAGAPSWLGAGTAGYFLLGAGAADPVWTDQPTLTSLEGLTLTNGDIIYASAADTLVVLDSGAQGTLLMGNAAAAPSWLGAGTANYVLLGAGAADPVWTAEAGFKTALNLEAGTDFYSISAADTAFEAELDDSAGLLAALSDETGTGVAVFGTAPTFTTSITMGSAGLTEPELEILDGATLTTTQANYLASATGTTGTTNTNLVFSTSPVFVTPTLGVATGTSLTLDAASDPAKPGWVFRDGDNLGADKEIAKIYADALDNTDGSEDGGLYLQAMLAGSEVTAVEWNSLTEALTLGDSGTGEDLVWDFETATDNGVTVSSNSGVTEINWSAIGFVGTGIFDFDGAHLIAPAAESADGTLATLGEIHVRGDEDRVSYHVGAGGEVAGEVTVSVLKQVSFSVDPGSWYDSDAEIFIMEVHADLYPNGVTIDEWKVSCNVDPDVEIVGDLKRCTAWIGLGSAAVIDVCDTANGVSSEDTDANINGDAVVAAGQKIYFSFDSDPEGTCVQMHFTMIFHAEED